MLTAIDLASGVKTATIRGRCATSTTAGQTPSTVSAGGAVVLKSSTGADLSVTGKADILKALGLTTATGAGNVTVSATRTTSSATLASFISYGFDAERRWPCHHLQEWPDAWCSSLRSTPAARVRQRRHRRQRQLDGLPAGRLDRRRAEGYRPRHRRADASRSTAARDAGDRRRPDGSSINASGQLKVSTGVNADLSITGTGNALQTSASPATPARRRAFTAARTSGAGGINGKTLTFTSFNGGTAVNVTFGDGTNGTVKTLDQLNTALQANNLTATIDANGLLTISSTNDYASSTIGSSAAGGAIGGTLTSSLTFSTASSPVQDRLRRRPVPTWCRSTTTS